MLNRIGGVARGAGRFFAQFARTMLHGIGRATSLVFLLNRTAINYAKLVKLDRNNIVTACVSYKTRVFTDASLMLEEWLPDREEWAPRHRDRVLDLLERPNRFYSWSALAKATLFDLDVGNGGGGDAYWFKVRNSFDTPIELWWLPAHLVEPKGDDRDPTVFISHYEYTVNGEKKPLRPQDVIHFRYGIDPDNPRRGLGPLKTLFREVFSDDEAANMTASLLRNVGVPGVIISPENDATINPQQADEIKEKYKEKFGGDRTGEPMVLGGAAKVHQFGFSPEQMQLRALRGIPEERIAANLGVSAAVVGLGTGLAQTKVGATLREYREHDVETTIVPLWREIASELTHQLLPDFKPGPRKPDGTAVDPNWRFTFDLSRVRVLQEDELKRTERIERLTTSGLIRISEGRRALGFPVLPEHEIYLRPNNLITVPPGPVRFEPPGGGGNNGE